MKKTILYLNDHDYLLIEAIYVPIWDINSWSPMRITLHVADTKYILFDEWLRTMPRDFANLLQRLLNDKEGALHPSITKDIGLIWNQIQHGSTDAVFEKCIWVGMSHRAFTTPSYIQPNVSTWLYTNPDGSITFTVTENYFWHYLEKDKGKNYQSYSAFLKRYQPLVTLTLSQETIKAWFTDVDALAKRIEQQEAAKREQEQKEAQECARKREQEKKKKAQEKSAKKRAVKKSSKKIVGQKTKKLTTARKKKVTKKKK